MKTLHTSFFLADGAIKADLADISAEADQHCNTVSAELKQKQENKP